MQPIAFVGRNLSVFSALTHSSVVRVVHACFPPGLPITPALVTCAAVAGVPFALCADSAAVEAVLPGGLALGVCCGFEPLRAEVFSRPRLGFVNLHPAPLPDYKGRTPWFYQLDDNARVAGASLHQLTEAIDGGPIYGVERFPLRFDDDYARLAERCDQAMIRLLEVHLPALLQGQVTAIPNDESRPRRGIRGRQSFSFGDSPVRIYNRIRSQRVFGGCPVTGPDEREWVLADALLEVSPTPEAEPGRVVKVEVDAFSIALKDGLALRVSAWEPPGPPAVGDRFSGVSGLAGVSAA